MQVLETHGPFDVYTEVTCKRGTFGLVPGQVLEVLEDGVRIVDAGDPKKSNRRKKADEQAEGESAQE